MKSATMKLSAFLLLAACFVIGTSVNAQAQQTNPAFDGEFIFFIDGANVQIPTLDGVVANDPLNPTSGNKTFRIAYGDWSEAGFRWPSNGPEGTVGVNATSVVGESYGESDTLYTRFLFDTTQGPVFGNEFIGFLDTENGASLGDDLPFRLTWYVPDSMRNGEWWEIALPLPPATVAGLDSAKAGKDINGNELVNKPDSLFLNWAYAGAWAAGDATGCFDATLDCFQEFQWNSIKYFGRFIDRNSGGGDMYIDYFSIGVPPEELVDSAPAAVSGVQASAEAGTNTITWSDVPNSGGYNVYFSESAITDVLGDGVELIGSVDFGEPTTTTHEIVAPHSSLADDFTSYYAVTAKSPFGAEGAAGTADVTGPTKVRESYAYQLSDEASAAVFTAVSDQVMPDAATLAAFFPESYVPFPINENRKSIENGDGGSGDADISSLLWMGFTGGEFNELILYAEITDDVLSFAAAGGDRDAGGSGAWSSDSYEMGLGNYSPESFLASSPHTDMEFGDDPDYQFRFGLFSDEGEAPFTFVTQVLNAEIPNSASVGEVTDTGYRLLTLVSTIEISGGDSNNVAFDFPEADEVTTYPFNYALNDADETGSRETQISWSARAGGDGWWNTPNFWEVIAFVGANRVTVSNEEDNFENPYTFSLDQNYPNPFNPSTNISFTLEGATDVTLEVFNVLGQKVATVLNNERLNAGSHMRNFDASSLSSGVYFYRISTASNFVQTRKMLLIK